MEETELKKDVEKITLVKNRCSKCNSAQTYVTKKAKICRKCGFREVLIIEPEPEPEKT